MSVDGVPSVALETVRNVDDRAAVQVADSALAEPKEQD